MQIYKIDNNGFFVKDVVIEDGEEMPRDCVEVQPPQGLYKARWDGSRWVEDMTQEEIDELNNQPRELTEIEKLKISQVEQFETILMLIGGEI